MTLPLVVAIGVVLRLIGGVVVAIVEGLAEERTERWRPLASGGASVSPVRPLVSPQAAARLSRRP